MKIVLLGVIFASISYIGFQYGNTYKEKELFYEEFSNFLFYLKSEISFLKTDLFCIFKEFKTKNKNLQFLLQNFKGTLLNNNKINLKILKEEENLEILNFFKGLGKTDCFTQNEFIEHEIEVFEKKLRESKEYNLKYGIMYKKLGILFALFVCIVLI